MNKKFLYFLTKVKKNLTTTLISSHKFLFSQQLPTLVLFFTVFFPKEILFATELPIDFSISYGEFKSSSNPTLKLTLTPAPQHHFNLTAPNKILFQKEQGSEELILHGDSSALFSQMNKIENFQNCELKIKVFLCDDKNTYCLPKEKSLSCKEFLKPDNLMTATQEKKWLEALNQTQKNSSNQDHKKKSQNESLFILNNPKLALEKAKIENKPLLIDFFGTWCPPCNILDETIFNHPKFQALNKKMIYLKLDADLPISWELKSKFAIKGYPTVILASPQAHEISRIIGVLELQPFLKRMTFAIKNKNNSIENLLEKLKQRPTSTLAWELIEAYNNQENYIEALDLLPLASKKKDLSFKEKDLLQYIPLKVSFNNSDLSLKKTLVNFIKTSIENFPFQETFLDKITMLEAIADETKDESLKKWAQLQTLKITNDFNKTNPKENEFLTSSDILFLRAQAFEKLGFKTEAKFTYSEALKDLDKQIKLYKLDPKTNRGFNLNRVYAIYKSGEIEEANKLYQNLSQIYPEEFTFYYDHADLLRDIGKKEEALEKAKMALKYSYGDNKLRAAYMTSELLKSLDKKDQALALIDDVLKSFELPEDKSIRTHRYYKKLVDLKSKL